MEVLKSTFASQEGEMLEALHSCDFVAIDCEFSGLRDSGPQQKELPSDSLQSRYELSKKSAENFALLQMGLCTFRWDESGKLEAKPFTVPLFPAEIKGATDRRFLMQTSSMHFLLFHGFDFGKWTREGVPYLSLEDEAAAATVLEKQRRSREAKMEARNGRNERPGGGNVSMNADEMHLLTEVKALASKLAAHPEQFSKDEKGRPFAVLEPASGRVRFLTHHFMPDTIMVSKEAEDNADLAARGTNLARLRLTTVSGKEEKAAEVSAKRSEGDNEVDRELRNAVGFRRILDALIALKKPIVGHNCLLDFLHIHDKLMGKLPATLDDFTSGLHEAFPRIFDSKILMARVYSVLRLSNTTLGDAYASLRSSKVSQLQPSEAWDASFAEGYDRFSDAADDSPFHHEAGYDAYLTGVMMAAVFCIEVNQKLSEGTSIDQVCAAEEEPFHSRLQKWMLEHPSVNEITLYRFPSPLQLPGPTKEPDLSEFLDLTGFPPSTQQRDLLQALDRYKAQGEPRSWLHWISDTRVVLECGSTTKAARILEDRKRKKYVAASPHMPLCIENMYVSPLTTRTGGMPDPPKQPTLTSWITGTCTTRPAKRPRNAVDEAMESASGPPSTCAIC